MVLSKVGAIQSADATEYLTSAINGYKKSASEAMSVVDALSRADVISASSVEDLSIALQKSANSASTAGVNMNTLIGWIAEVKEVTQKSASTIGESFKTILSRLGSVKAGTFLDTDTESDVGTDITSFVNDTEKVLSKVGIKLRDSTNSFRDAEDVINDVAKAWGNYTDLEKNAIATAIAGTRQRENFLALMNNYNRAMYIASEATNSEGSAMQKYNVYQESVSANLETLIGQLQTFTSSSGMEELLKTLLDIANALMTVVNKMGGFSVVLASGITSIIALRAQTKSFTTALHSAWSAIQTGVESGKTFTETFEALSSAQKAAVQAEAASAVVKNMDTAATTTNTTATWANVAAKRAGVAVSKLWAMAISNPIPALIAITIAVVALVAIIKKLHKSTKELKSDLSGGLTESENNQSNLDQLNEKLQTTNARIDELKGKGKLSITEKSELQNLENQNTELETQIILLQQKTELQNKANAKNAEELYGRGVSVQTEVKTSTVDEGAGTYQPVEGTEVVNQQMSYDKAINTDLAKLRALQEQYKTASDSEKVTIEQSITDLKSKLVEYIETSQILYDGLKDTDPEKAAKIKAAMDAYTEFFETTEDKAKDIMSDDSLAGVVSTLKTLGSEGQVTANNITSSSGLMAALNNAGISAQDFADYLNEASKSENSVSNSTVALNGYLNTIATVGDEYEMVAEAQVELNKNGYLSISTIKKLSEKFTDLEKYLIATKDGFKLTTGSVWGLVDAEGGLYEQELNNAKVAANAVLQSEGQKTLAISATTQAYIEQLAAQMSLDMELERSINKMAGGTDKSTTDEIANIKSIINNLTAAQNNVNISNQLKGMYKSAANSSSSGSSSSSKEEETAYEKQIRILEHKLYLSQQISGLAKDDVTQAQRYLEELKKQNNLYKQLENAVHAHANSLRAQGYSETSKEIEEAQKQWWTYENARRDNAKETDDYVDNLTSQEVSYLKDAISEVISNASKALDKLKDRYSFLIDKNNALVDLMEKYNDAVNNIDDEMRNINGELEDSMASLDYLDESLRETMFNEDDYKALSNKLANYRNEVSALYDQYYNEINKLGESEYWKIDGITKEYTAQFELKSKEYAIAEQELNLVKAQTKLQNVLANRNVRMYKNGQWIWTADHEAVADAMKDVTSAESDVAKANIEYEQATALEALKALTTQYEKEQAEAEAKYKLFEDGWNDVIDSIQTPTKTIAAILEDMSKSGVPTFKQIMDEVGDALAELGATLKMPKSSLNMTGTGTATTPSGQTQTITIINGKTQEELAIGTIVHTAGGDYKITGGTAGNYTSEKVETGTTSSGSSGGGSSGGGSSGSSSGGSYSSSGDDHMSGTVTATTPDGKTVSVDVLNGKTQTELPYGTIVHTGGGDYEIIGGSAGHYESKPASKSYDSGGILSGIGGIKATSRDETVFDGDMTSKMLNPEKSKQFLQISEGLSGILSNSGGLSKLVGAINSVANVGQSHVSNVDSHNIVLPNGFMSTMTDRDSQTISSIIRRYIPIT